MYSHTTSIAGQLIEAFNHREFLFIKVTFRYRRNVKSLEENLEEQQSLVPKLKFAERRVVPPHTSPELVMFCRRVYDFRSKRLIEDKKKK